MCVATKAVDSNLKELILLEEFKSCLPEHIVVYLNEQKVAFLTNASMMADEFVLTYKSVFSSIRTEPLSSSLHLNLHFYEIRITQNRLKSIASVFTFINLGM